jgi:HK97 family phage major capsid protein
MRNLVVRMTERSEDAAVDKFTQLLDGISTRKPVVEEPIDQAPARVPARSAGRTLPAALTDSRYRFLPDWQKAFRSPDSDYEVSRYMRALASNDQVTLRTIHAEDKLLRADLLEGVSTGAPFDGTVGQLLPLPVSNYLLEALYKGARMRQHARVFQRSQGASLRIPTQNLASVSTWVAEGLSAAGTSPTVSTSISLVLQKLTHLVAVSNEVLEDEVFGLASWLINDVGMEMAEREDEALYGSGGGAGSQEPRGLEAADTTITGATLNPVWYVQGPDQAADNIEPTTINYAHLLKMYFRLPEKERTGAIWTGNSLIAEALSAMVDLNGRPILRMANEAGGIVSDAQAGGATSTVLGRPFVEMPGLLDASGTPGEDDNRLYFINMGRAYAILEAGGVRVAATNEGGAAFAEDETHFRFIRRVDGAPTGQPIPTKPQYVYTGAIEGFLA